MVLLHGVTDDGLCWGPFAPGWAQGRRVVAVDARGHGDTPLGEPPFTITALAADVAAVIRAELGGGPAVVVGHSMGGLVAEELAIAEPALVAALVLEDPAWRADPDVDRTGGPAHLNEAIRMNAARTVEDLLELAPVWNPQWPVAELAPWARSKTRVDPRLADTPQVWDARDWPAVLDQVRVPVTLLVGDPVLGAIVDEPQVEAVAAPLGDRLTVVHAAAGHNVRREAPAVVDAAVRRVLALADAVR
ncbi:alpha/beta hydrolase [Actinotalea sp. M2MS4P-6]|uniref:alpha/beta fold hydrolase n=1 Tax=Actinotalea sp. M2MS4P-6 TaxID=2983762 RepID=UPI0021E46449|nr:alpha/beta hydrolase [Actinotalea sp. M2MS4P-6]MCV2393215.1 alpha/beta hydrolase [Actinotalea sp. M2MS4P-6]